jgi:hypothetical protein
MFFSRRETHLARTSEGERARAIDEIPCSRVPRCKSQEITHETPEFL